MLAVMTSGNSDGTDPSNQSIESTRPSQGYCQTLGLSLHGANCAWFRLAPTLSIHATFFDLSRVIISIAFILKLSEILSKFSSSPILARSLLARRTICCGYAHRRLQTRNVPQRLRHSQTMLPSPSRAYTTFTQNSILRVSVRL